MRILGFDWNEINAQTVEHHGLGAEDIEELFAGKPVVFRHPEKPYRWIALGESRNRLCAYERKVVESL